MISNSKVYQTNRLEPKRLFGQTRQSNESEDQRKHRLEQQMLGDKRRRSNETEDEISVSKNKERVIK